MNVVFNKGESNKPVTAVFVDYESWFWGLYNKYGEKPDLQTFIEDVKKRGQLKHLYFFGDFTKDEINKERAKLRTYTNEIIDCANNTSYTKKDYTDFIMLDHIYKTILQSADIEQYILVTGDGHFHSVTAYLTTFIDKIVGVYGVKGSFSEQLKQCASWVAEIEPQDSQFEVKKILNSISWVERKGIKPSFRKTVEQCANYFNLDTAKVSASLKKLIDEGYIEQVTESHSCGSEFRILKTDWNLLKKHGIWDLTETI